MLFHNRTVSSRSGAGRLKGAGRSALLATVLTGLFLAPARAEYLLQPGDTLDFSLIGMTDVKQRTTVGPDGDVVLPVVGQVQARGLSIPQLKAQIKAQMNNKLFRQITNEGKENMIVLSGDEVSLEVFAYRPIYVSGDVLRPGEQPFRPGMTVRQAVSVAGGYDALKMRLGNPLVDPIDFQSEYGAQVSEYVREQARNIRLQAEVAGTDQVDFTKIVANGIPASQLNQIIATEKQQFAVRTGDIKREQQYLKDAVAAADKRVALLNEQRERETQGQVEDSNELDRVKDLVQRGAAAVTRITDARRTLLFSATRVLQTVTQVTQMERDREDLNRKVVRVYDEYKKEALKDLQDSNVKMSALRARVDGLREKLGIAAAPRLIQREAVKPTLVVFRKAQADVVRTEVALDAELTPGDVVEVTVPVEDVLGGPMGVRADLPTR